MNKTGNEDADALLAQLAERHHAESVARGQREALARTLDLLAAEPELDSFVGQVLKALTEQLGAHSGSFWLYDAVHNQPVLRLDYDNSSPDAAAVPRMTSANQDTGFRAQPRWASPQPQYSNFQSYR